MIAVLKSTATAALLVLVLTSGAAQSSTPTQASQSTDQSSNASQLASLPQPSKASGTEHPRKSALMKRTWGIEVLGVHLVAGGYMLEFRYRVIDPEKAKVLANRKIKPYLVDLATGAKVIVPSPEKVGELRNINSQVAGKTYWIMFANPARMVKAGSKVAVVIGDFQANNMVVN